MAAATLAGKSDTRVVVIGDPGTGKSSLIIAVATEQFPENAPAVVPATRLPADYFPDKVPITIIDTSSSPEQKAELFAECQAADAVVLTYACDRPDTLERLSSFWLPELRRLQLKAPVIVVGCKLDLRNENQFSLEQVMAPIMVSFREIETCIECSALRQIQIPEVFYYAQKAVLHPTAPLFDLEAQSLRPRCVEALKRIFLLSDHDNDGALSDVELNEFQVRCFSSPLQPTEIAGVKRVVQEKMTGAVNDNGLTLTGFLFLHALFIEKGRLETTWTVLRKFGYDNDLNLRDDLSAAPMKRAPDQVPRGPSELQVLQRLQELSVSENSTSIMDDMYMELNILERTFKGVEEPSNIKLFLLKIITDNFSDDLKIGNGGCGVVYKGILRNGVIAVKRLFNSHTIEDRMFHQEVQSLMMVKHQNMVRFLGYCSHTEEKAIVMAGKIILAQIRERLLCFEYLHNGSLEDHITDELRGLEWHIRYQIIQGICEGLQHLHKEKHIIHMDLKPANILLDEHMMPKITDFGLSILDDKSRTLSAERLISLGYCAPEYQNDGNMSAKSDIYSLGAIITEVVTGSKEKPTTKKVLKRWKHRWNKSVKDTQLGYIQVAKCLDLAQRCRHADPTDRPNIWNIVSDLHKIDSTAVHSNDTTEYLELEDMLGIEPLEMHLPFKLNQELSCSIELTNDTDRYFAFRISTTSLWPYNIVPDRDIVPPRSKCIVAITLQALEKALPHNHWKDEFSVQSTTIDGSLRTMDITGDMFNEEDGKVVDKVNLIIVLDAPSGEGQSIFKGIQLNTHYF